MANASGDISNVPLRYQTSKGIFDEEIALHFSHFVRKAGRTGPKIALSSVSSLLIQAHRHSINVGLFAEDFAKLPNSSSIPLGALMRINSDRADIQKARDCFEYCKAKHGRIVCNSPPIP